MRPFPGRRILAGLGIVGLSAGLTARAAPACEIRVLEARDATLLQSIPLGETRRFDLTYLHSVTKTAVRETLVVEAGGFTQQRIEFFEPGPGLPTQALPGERFMRQADRFIYDNMQRRIGTLQMRVDPLQMQALEVAGTAHPLTRWDARAVQLQAYQCE